MDNLTKMKRLALFVFIFLKVTSITDAKFEPYELNGGLVCAIAGKDFCVIASDTRMIGPGGYLLSSRNLLSSRLWSVNKSDLMNDIERSLRENLSDDSDVTSPTKHFELPEAPVMIGTAGCNADCIALQRVIQADVRAASHLGQTTQTRPDQIASLLSQTLYSRRNFPYYSFCCLAGIDTNGGGAVFVYDAIGSYEQVSTAVVGTGRETLQPILDRKFRRPLCVSVISNRFLKATTSTFLYRLISIHFEKSMGRLHRW